MFAVLNVETGDLYSESPALKNEAKRTGRRWDNTSILPSFARRYKRMQDAARRALKVSEQTGSICAVITLE